jgi:chlorobactene glucosyltransferase
VDDHPVPPAGSRPLVSIVVPARNEAENISACVATLLNSEYEEREIIVVDDGSVDGTADIARILASHSDGGLRLVEGEPLPSGWLGKNWACWQGYRAATGELLLFTDADTRHDDALLGHAVGALAATGADLVSVFPRQLMETFWERVVLPHIFTMLSLRYRDLRRVNRTREPRDVIANGQFILMRRDAYERFGGHEAVRGCVVEDLRIAQLLVRKGGRLHLAHAEDLMETRMYRSLAGIVEGWSKNLAIGSRSTVPPLLRPFLPWLIGLSIIGFWTVPATFFVAALLGFGGPFAAGWSLAACAASVPFWLLMHYRYRIPLVHALFFPLGGLVAGAVFMQSALRGERVRWKGRTYQVDGVAGD